MRTDSPNRWAEVTLCAVSSTTQFGEDAMRSLLSRQELERASAFRHDIDRSRFLIGHGAVRALAARHLGVRSTEVPFTQDGRGRPELPDTGLECSTSHSGDFVAVALSGDRTGVDVECHSQGVPTGWDLVALAAELEPKGLEPHAHFLHRWTQMEAVMKVTGLGLAAPKDTRTLIHDEGLRSHYGTPFGLTTCVTLELDDDHALSVCTMTDLTWSLSMVNEDLVPGHLPILRSWRGTTDDVAPAPSSAVPTDERPLHHPTVCP